MFMVEKVWTYFIDWLQYKQTHVIKFAFSVPMVKLFLHNKLTQR